MLAYKDILPFSSRSDGPSIGFSIHDAFVTNAKQWSSSVFMYLSRSALASFDILFPSFLSELTEKLLAVKRKTRNWPLSTLVIFFSN